MTDQTLPPPVPKQDQQKSGGRNCWVIGCSGCLIAILVMIIVGWGIGAMVKKSFTGEPHDPIEMTEQERAESKQKLQEVGLLEDGEAEASELPDGGLVLTEQDLNYLISRNPELVDTVRLDLEPGEISADLRVDMENGKRLMLKGTIQVKQKGDLLEIYLTDVRIGKFSLPRPFMDEVAKEDLAVEIFSDPETRRQFQQNVERIEVRKDEVLIVPKKKAE